jgi:hypothetical protein
MRNAFAEDLAPRRRYSNICQDITRRSRWDPIYTQIQEASMPLRLPWKRATSGGPKLGTLATLFVAAFGGALMPCTAQAKA